MAGTEGEDRGDRLGGWGIKKEMMYLVSHYAGGTNAWVGTNEGTLFSCADNWEFRWCGK